MFAKHLGIAYKAKHMSICPPCNALLAKLVLPLTSKEYLKIFNTLPNKLCLSRNVYDVAKTETSCFIIRPQIFSKPYLFVFYGLGYPGYHSLMNKNLNFKNFILGSGTQGRPRALKLAFSKFH